MMKIHKLLLLSAVSLTTLMPLSGCWNYREVEKLAVVAGVTVDKSPTDGKYELTVEIIEIKAGKESKVGSKLVSIRGNTLFDAARNAISLSGNKLYWSHAKVVIFSQEVAREGLIKVLDWISRDAETRADINILISGEKTAKEIFTRQASSEKIRAFEINNILENQKSLSKAAEVHVGEFLHDEQSPGISPSVPAIALESTDSSVSPIIVGTAIFKRNVLVGFLSQQDSKYLLFIKNELKGGLLIEDELDNEGNTRIALEIFGNETKVKPVEIEDNIEININTETVVAIGEIMGSTDYIKDELMLKLEKDAEKELESRIENLVKKLQIEYNSDIFGFGEGIKIHLPEEWRKLEPKWDEKFKDLVVNVKSKIKIRNSAMRSETIEVGDTE